MKNLFITAITALATFTTQAQFQLGLLTDYHYSYLYNKSDAAADARLDYVDTYKPAFGAVVGYKINDKLAVQIAPQYFGAGQQFTSPSPALGLCKSIEDKIDLHYLQLPLTFQYSFGNADYKLRHFINAGLYFSNLISYKQQTVYDGYANTGINKVKNNSIEMKGKDARATSIYQTLGADSSVVTNFKFNNNVFNFFDFGLHLGYGISYAINANMALQANLNVKYGFAAVDNTDTISATNAANPNDIRKFSISDVIYCRNNIPNGLPNQTKRTPKSTNIFAGLQLSFIYTFPSRKLDRF
jgi:Outer membrane protein beta-barrel domain